MVNVDEVLKKIDSSKHPFVKKYKHRLMNKLPELSIPNQIIYNQNLKGYNDIYDEGECDSKEKIKSDANLVLSTMFMLKDYQSDTEINVEVQLDRHNKKKGKFLIEGEEFEYDREWVHEFAKFSKRKEGKSYSSIQDNFLNLLDYKYGRTICQTDYVREALNRGILSAILKSNKKEDMFPPATEYIDLCSIHTFLEGLLKLEKSENKDRELSMSILNLNEVNEEVEDVKIRMSREYKGKWYESIYEYNRSEDGEKLWRQGLNETDIKRRAKFLSSLGYICGLAVTSNLTSLIPMCNIVDEFSEEKLKQWEESKYYIIHRAKHNSPLSQNFKKEGIDGNEKYIDLNSGVTGNYSCEEYGELEEIKPSFREKVNKINSNNSDDILDGLKKDMDNIAMSKKKKKLKVDLSMEL